MPPAQAARPYRHWTCPGPGAISTIATAANLTGTQTQYYALCIPGDDGYTALFPYVSYEKQGVLYDRRNLAAPFLIEVSRDLTGRGIATCAVPAHTVDIAPHLLGYLDGEGRGVAGLERAYDALLTASGDKRTVSCVLAAHSGLMRGQACMGYEGRRHRAGRAADTGRRLAARL